MNKEFNDHCERQHRDIVPIQDDSKDEKVLCSGWSMRRKRNVLTKQVCKWKEFHQIRKRLRKRMHKGEKYTELFIRYLEVQSYCHHNE